MLMVFNVWSVVVMPLGTNTFRVIFPLIFSNKIIFQFSKQIWLAHQYSDIRHLWLSDFDLRKSKLTKFLEYEESCSFANPN